MHTEIRLQQIGDELELAFAADLQTDGGKAPAHTRGRRSWFATRRGRWLAAAAAAVIAVPGVAYAAGAFTSPQTVAKTLPGSDRIFGGNPTRIFGGKPTRIFGGKPACTVVRPNVEYRCTLAKAPSPDPVTHLTPAQWAKFLSTPPNRGKVKFVNRRYKDSNGRWIIGQFAQDLPRIERITQAYRDQVLASFGFRPAQIKAYNEAVFAGAAGISAGQFKGTLEPTIDATHHINGGCRATSADGTRWDCYLGQAASSRRSSRVSALTRKAQASVR